MIILRNDSTTIFTQQLDHGLVAVLDRVQQGRASTLVLQVDVSAFLNKKLCHVNIVVVHSSMQQTMLVRDITDALVVLGVLVLGVPEDLFELAG